MKFRLLASLLLVTIFSIRCATTSSTSDTKVLRKIPREERIALMVINFKNTTLKDKADKYQPWEFGIPSMIMTDLESIGLFNILSWERLKDVAEQLKLQHIGMVDEKDAVEIGKIAAARYLLAGNFMVMGGTLRIESKVFSVETGVQLGASAVKGKAGRFFELEKELVIEMTSYLGAILTSEEKTQIAENIETKSMYASLNNYAGEIALIKADSFKVQGKKDNAEKLMKQARARFEKALKYDPGYERAKKNLASLTMAIPMTL